MSQSNFENSQHHRNPPSAAEPVKPRDRKAMIVKLSPEQIKALKQLALDLDSTMQELVSQEIAKLLKRHNRG